MTVFQDDTAPQSGTPLVGIKPNWSKLGKE